MGWRVPRKTILPWRAARRAGIAFAIIALAACGSARPQETASSPVAPTVAEPTSATPETSSEATAPRAIESCAATAPAAAIDFSSAHVVGDIGEVTWALARTFRSPTPGNPILQHHLVHLDAHGALIESALPELPSLAAIEGDGIRTLSFPAAGPVTTRRITIRGDAIEVGPPTPLSGIPRGWPERLATNGELAVLSLRIADGDDTRFAAYWIDVRSARVVHTIDARTEVLGCDARACTVARYDEPGRFELIRRALDGTEETRILGTAAQCGGAYAIPTRDGIASVLQGDEWSAAISSADGIRALAIVPEAAHPACVAVYGFPSLERPGLVQGYTGSRALLRVDASTFGAPEPLPETPYRRQVRAAYRDGVIEVGWNGGSGMMHSPTDRETRRYFSVWEFEGGEASLLRFESGAWRATDRVPLTLANAEGTLHEGYEPIVLRHELHAAILLTPAGLSDPAWLQPYRAPCVSRAAEGS